MKIVKDEFNSEIFELSMANIENEGGMYHPEELDDIVLSAQKAGFQHLSIKVDISDKEMLYSCVRLGFLPVDTQIMYEISLKNNPVKRNTGITRPYDITDKDSILRIAGSAYKIDRFHSDPYLPDDKCNYYYEQWAKNLCESLADKIFVIDTDENTRGYLSLKFDNNTARVILAAIDSAYQGNGYFTALMTDVIYYLETKGFEYLYYGTQLGNIPVLRTVGRLNGVPKFSRHVLHRML